MKVNPLVCKVICMANIDHFSAVEIRTAYIVLANDSTLNGAKIRKLVYSELLKLVKSGWLIKLKSDVKGITRFKKSDKFNSDELNKNILNQVDSSHSILIKQLNHNLNKYNSDLLQGLGELETYTAIRNEHPNIRELLKTKVMAVQENSHILKGKINAIEEILKVTLKK